MFVIPLAVLFEYSVNAFHQPLMVGYIGLAGEGIRTIGKQRHEAGAIRFYAISCGMVSFSCVGRTCGTARLLGVVRRSSGSSFSNFVHGLLF